MNWVERRHECNAKHALQNLRAEARGNVDTRVHQMEMEVDHSLGSPPQLEDVKNGFTVTRNGRVVKFETTDLRTIEINGDIKFKITVKVGLDDEQQCVLTVKDEPKEPWQVLYKALDELLF